MHENAPPWIPTLSCSHHTSGQPTRREVTMQKCAPMIRHRPATTKAARYGQPHGRHSRMDGPRAAELFRMALWANSKFADPVAEGAARGCGTPDTPDDRPLSALGHALVVAVAGCASTLPRIGCPYPAQRRPESHGSPRHGPHVRHHLDEYNATLRSTRTDSTPDPTAPHPQEPHDQETSTPTPPDHRVAQPIVVPVPTTPPRPQTNPSHELTSLGHSTPMCCCVAPCASFASPHRTRSKSLLQPTYESHLTRPQREPEAMAHPLPV